jgi:phage shock protein PspC (stress-responsive transcriptional regulator)
MEKIININFQGRVIPIEEPAYNALKEYSDSLRRYFAAEESSDEIVSDIESRIAELLALKLKQGANCINLTDLNAVIDSIGRIEDMQAADEEEKAQTKSNTSQAEPAGTQQNRFARNADDKVIAGVCSGIANRMNVDPAIVRVLFVVLFGALFWLYILLWIIVPSESIKSKVTRRFFRNPDDKMIAGVAGGLAVYFRIETWKVRLIFLLPTIIGIISNGAHNMFSWHWDWGSGFFLGSLGSTLFILYVVLWIATPFASSSTDKMEMRGEKIDINSIKAATQARANEAASAARSAGNGIGRAIGILFKAFFLFIAGVLAVTLFAVLVGLVFAGTAAFPFTNFVMSGFDQYVVAWIAVACCLGVPLLALVVWLVRRLMGVRTRRHYLGYVFGGLWVVGIVCALIAGGTAASNFSAHSTVEEVYQIQQPTAGKLYINAGTGPGTYVRHDKWYFRWDNEDQAPFHLLSKDSLWLSNITVNIEQSPDSLFHIYQAKESRGKTSAQAKELVDHIVFSIAQADSVITLPRGFVISDKDKFRAQEVTVTVEVPVGKGVQFSEDIHRYGWFDVNTGYEERHHDYRHYYRHHRRHRMHRSHHHDYDSEHEYVMTAKGIINPNDTISKRSDDVSDDE